MHCFVLWSFNACFNSRPHEEVDVCAGRIDLIVFTFQLTTSRRGRLRKAKTFLESKLFQLTTSRRGRLLICSSTRFDGMFQLTTSRRGRLRKAKTFLESKLFQLTTSRRGRRKEPPGGAQQPERFNSRPHEEVDWQVRKNTCKHIRFNSRPHEEVDCQTWFLLSFLVCFNSRPHEEVDCLLSSSIAAMYRFNSRPHEEVDYRNRR